MKKYLLFFSALSFFLVVSVFAETKTVYVNKHFERQIEDDGTIIDKIFVYDGGVSGTKIATVETTRREGEDPVTRTIYHHEDHLTGANVDTDPNGQVMQLFDYYPYGETRIDEHLDDYYNPYQFTGKERDRETGLIYYGSRYHNPTTGRFSSRDPWGGDIYNPQSLNKYSYVQNNPLKYTDPTGELLRAINRPVEELGVNVGAHSFVEITNNPKINNGNRTTLGGYTTGFFTGDLFKAENYPADYNLSEKDYLATHEITPIAPYSQTGYEEKVYESYQGLDTNLGAYSPLGGEIKNGQGNSGNVFTQILRNAGLSTNEIKTYTAPIPWLHRKTFPNSYNAGVGRELPTKKVESFSSKMGNFLSRLRSNISQTNQQNTNSQNSNQEEDDND